MKRDCGDTFNDSPGYTYVLGIACGMHDSSASLLRDGELIAFAEEERFIRDKHTGEFPHHAIRYCLSEAGIEMRQVAHIAYFWNPRKGIIRRLAYLLSRKFRKNGRMSYYLSVYRYMKNLPKKLRREYGFRGKFHYVSHHRAHLAGAYYYSPFEEAALLTVDGTGEAETAVGAHYSGKSRKTVFRSFFPDSLGYFYGALTDYLGFRTNSGEGKVMGLASYGQPSYYEEFSKIIWTDRKGRFRIDRSLFEHPAGGYSFSPGILKDIIGEKRGEREPISRKHEDIAASLQRVFEEVLLNILTVLREKSLSENLCLNGGVFLNCTANGRILRESGFKNIFIFPSANDAGASAGAAAFVCLEKLKSGRRFPIKHAYLGPSFTEEYIEKELKMSGISYRKSGNICRDASLFLAANKIVGWFQGRMEAGPRALGNRSILASPASPDMKDLLNRRVKFRESFRPFAPAVLKESAELVFDTSGALSPYMLFSFDVKEEYSSKIPSVVHVDGTSRVQTVSQDDNPLFHKLIKEFEKITGLPLLLNTSFNTRGEPIVCTPKDAIDAFTGTEMDYLVIGDFIAEK